MKIGLALFVWALFIIPLLLLSGSGCDSGQLHSTNMSPAEKLYRARCASCHRLRKPESQTDDEWVVYVDKYGKKLNENEKNLILQYLQANN